MKKGKNFHQKFRLYSHDIRSPAISDENLQLEFKPTEGSRQTFRRLYKFYVEKTLEETSP